jgi:hypothetical protein
MIPAKGSVAITKEPVNGSGAENDFAEFTVDATSTDTPLVIFWQRNGNGIKGAVGKTLRLGPLTAAMNGSKIRAVASTPGATASSVEVTLTVTEDKTPPAMLRVAGNDNFDTVTVTFSEAVASATATVAGNYSISGLTISAAKQTAANKVQLTTSKQNPDTAYTLTVKNVRDTSIAGGGNVIAAPGDTKGFRSFVLKPGFVSFQVWTGLAGNSIQILLDDPRYPNSPAISNLAKSFNSRQVFANDANEAYGGRMKALLTPTESGSYELFIRSDDASQLFLSTDDNPANATQIAEETGCCGAFEESGAPETSAPINLVAGKRYYIQALWKEGTGGDFCQVAWRKLGDATAASALQPIPGTFLSTYLDISQGPPVLTEQPKSQRVAVGDTVALKVSAIGSEPFTYQWKFKGKDIAGATQATLTISNVQGGSAGDYVVILRNADGTATSAAANILVSGVPTVLFLVSNTAPTLNAADAAVKARLESQGWQVLVVGAAASQTPDAEGKQLIIVSSTIPSGDVGNKFQKSAVPVVNWEQALQDNLLMTGDVANTDRENIATQTNLEILNANHSLAAGLKAGVVQVATADSSFSWGLPADSAVKITQVPGDPTKFPIYAYETGAALIDGTKAPARRVNFMLTDDAFLNLNADGLKLFDAAVSWAANITVKPPAQVPKLSAARTVSGLTLTFDGALQSADSVTGPWTDVANAKSPLTIAPAGGQKFYRAKQ